MNIPLNHQNVDTYVPLAQVLKQYSVKGSTFSFVSPSDLDNRILIERVIDYFHSLHMSIETVQEISFPSMTVVENIYLETINAWGSKKKRQIEECRNLLRRYGIRFSTDTLFCDLTKEEQNIVYLLRVIVHDPEVIVLNNTTTTLGFSEYSAFDNIVKDMTGRGAIVLLLTTKWEEILKFSTDAAVRVEDGIYSVFSIQEIEQNPKRLLYTLAGGHKNEASAANANSFFALLKGSELFTENQQLDETIRYISGLVKRGLNADCCDFYFESDDEEIFTYHGEPGNTGFLLKDLTVKEFLHSNRDVLFLSKRIDDLASVYEDKPPECRVLLCVPVVVIPKRVGLMAVSFSYYFAYDSEQLLFLKTCCHEIAQIIQTHKLINHSILLQESYHRIKNNLQMVVSLLYLTKLRLFHDDDAKTKELETVLDNVIKQIKSIAYVHEMMSVDTGGEVTNMNYIVDKIAGLYANENVSVEKHVRNVRMSSKMATSVSMLINELLCNSCQHAFEQGSDKKAEIIVTLDVSEDQMVTLSVSDNGSGMEDPDQFFGSHSTGATIIRSLVNELHADFHITSRNGTSVQITFRLDKESQLYSAGNRSRRN